MAAGGPGDHPLFDILDHNLNVYGQKCDTLVREISKYASRDEMLKLIDWFNKEYTQNPAGFEIILNRILENLILDRKERGWEL